MCVCAVVRVLSGVFCVVCYFLCGLPKFFRRVDLLSLSLRQS